MKKDIKAIRVEIPTELYERFKKQLDKDYITPTAFVKNTIVKYTKEKEENMNGD